VTGHGAGTLRGEPVIVGQAQSDDAGMRGTSYLILAQSDGLAAMRLRAFTLQAANAPLGPSDDVPLPGWSWFAPTCDQEKLAVVTDAGTFALLNVNQSGNNDPPLSVQIISTPTNAHRLNRGQVVHMEERAYWYLADGALKMDRTGMDRKVGPKRADGWGWALKLGSPLHAPQVSADRTVLFVVTQTTAPPAWLATAVEAQTGAIKWQRPLGLAPQGDPVRLGEFIYQLDQGGGLYQIDPKQVNVKQGQEWTMGGQALLPPRGDVVSPPVLLTTNDGKSAYMVFTTGDGKQLQTRLVAPGQPVKVFPAAVLPATPAGTPLLVGTTLYIPLTNGALYRIGIGAKDGEIGPDWRAPGLTETATAFSVSLGTDVVLVSDGNRGLSGYVWPAGQPYQLKFQLKVQDRIVARPLVIAAKDAPPRVLVADAAGRLTALEGEQLAPALRWELRNRMRKGNDITGGPYLMDGDPANPMVLVILDQRTVVCISPDRQDPAWTCKAKGDGLAGPPRRRGDALILTDLAGRYEAIDASTGAAIGSGFPTAGVLPSAPAAAPVDFDASHLFAPLADGTVLLLPMEALVPK
jgi:hypothetical protein